MNLDDRARYDAMLAESWAETQNATAAARALVAKLRDAEQAHVAWVSAELEALLLVGARKRCTDWLQRHEPRVRTAEGGKVKTVGGARNRDPDTGQLRPTFEQLAFADMERPQLEDHLLKLARDIEAGELSVAALGRLLTVMDRVPEARTPREACKRLGVSVEAVIAGTVAL